MLLIPLAVIALAATGCGSDGDRPQAGSAADPPAAEQDRRGFTTATPAAIAPRAAAGEVLLVDVREDGEWAAGRAPDAIHVPLADVERELPRLRARAGGRPIAFVCRTGRRSAQAARLAADAGIAEVVNVDGGMSAWVAAGLPLVPAGGRVA